MLSKLDIDGKDMRLIWNLYWDQMAAIRIEGEISEWTEIKRGVRKGCMMSPDLFSLYSEIIMREISDMKGIIAGGQNINNLRYADNTVLLSESRDDLQLIEESHWMWETGLSLNLNKTECMVITKKKDVLRCNIQIHGGNKASGQILLSWWFGYFRWEEWSRNQKTYCIGKGVIYKDEKFARKPKYQNDN